MTNTNDFDAMIELVQSYCREEGNASERLLTMLRQVRELYPSQYPKLMVLMEAHKNAHVFQTFPLADKVKILRHFEVTDDFQGDVTRLLSLIIDRHAMEAFKTSDDPCDRAAKILVDRYGDNASWQQAMAILAE